MGSNLNSFFLVTSQYRSAIMGLSMLSIMLLHQWFINVFPFNFFHVFGNWGVDVFLFLSGMGLVNSLEKNTLKEFYRRRFIRILPSCFICGSLKYTFYLLFGSSLFILKEGLNLGIWSVLSLDLWFIYAIIIFYIITPILYYLFKKYLYETLIFVLLLFMVNGMIIRDSVGYDWLSPKGIFSWTVERFPIFSAGMIIAIYKGKINENYSLSAFFLLIAVLFKLIEKYGVVFNGIRACQFLSLTLGMPALICLNIFVLKKFHLMSLNFCSYLGKLSFELYLVHEFIFWSIKISAKNTNAFLELFGGFVLSSLVAFLCKQLVTRFVIPRFN